MSEMNGNLCKIVGSYRVDEDRYPVYVYKIKERVLIKRKNLKIVTIKPKIIIITEKQQVILERILSHTKHTKMNQARLFANNLLRSNPDNMFNPQLVNDLKYMLNGNCIYIQSFFNKNQNKNDLTIFNYLMKDLNGFDSDCWIKRFRRLMIGGRSQDINSNQISLTFKMITIYLADYFDVQIRYCLINLYRNGEDYASFHTDSYEPGEVDITIGASFGATRNLSFLHKKTKQTFPIKQNNCDVFAFTSKINKKFKHSILKTSTKIGPRFSIIVWGKRRTLNNRNSSNFERMEMR